MTHAEALLAEAGLAGGEVPFLENLDLLVRSSVATGRLNPTGLDVLRRAAQRHLRNLVEVQRRGASDNPPIDGPIVVTGLPRTGTTLLHNLLALDPAHRVLRFWEALRPAAGGGHARDDEAVARAERWLAAFYRLVPAFRTIHPATATGPEECDALLQNTFASQHFDDMFDGQEYSAWLATSPLSAEYECYASQLRLLGAPTGTRWVLKSPGHLGHLDALLAALPGCTVVLCRRDPRQAVASYASLIYTLRQAYSDSVSAAAVGRQALARASTSMERALAVRQSGAGASTQFIDVPYPELAGDPVQVVRELYDRLGRSLPNELAELMRAWCAANPPDRHGPHRYDLAQFGLTASEVDAALGGH